MGVETNSVYQWIQFLFFFFGFFFVFFSYYSKATKMATDTSDQRPAGGVKAENLTKTNKFEAYMKSGDLYSLPVTAVPGCGFMMGYLLKRNGITRASELYDLYTKQKKGFAKYLACKFGSWNIIYVNTVIKAFEEWEKIHVVKPEKKVKVVEEKKKGPPRKVGEGSKKWDDFLKLSDLSKVPIMKVPGVASTLGGEMKKRNYCTAKQLMDQFKGEKKGQCNSDEEKFLKWILCCFGYWNTQYSKVVLAALKAFDNKDQEVKNEPAAEETAGNADEESFDETDADETIPEMVTRIAEETADAIAEQLEEPKEEPADEEAAGNADEEVVDEAFDYEMSDEEAVAAALEAAVAGAVELNDNADEEMSDATGDDTSADETSADETSADDAADA